MNERDEAIRYLEVELLDARVGYKTLEEQHRLLAGVVNELRREILARDEQLVTMRAACSESARSTITALDRIMQMDPVVKAAQAWVDKKGARRYSDEGDNLVNATVVYNKLVAQRS